jgi:hypothetical protein
LRQQLLRVLANEKLPAHYSRLLAESQLTIDGISTSVFLQQMPVQLQIDERADAAHQRRNRPMLNSKPCASRPREPTRRHFSHGHPAN